MARKGKHAKKPVTGGTPKQKNETGKQVVSTDEKSKGKSPSNKGIVHGSIVKKQTSGDIGGFIFKCSGSTKADCFKYRVFGLNEGKKNLVEQVRKGMRLFLFDINLRLLYGIYVAASQGSYKLERDAFGGAFPWQVRFSIQKDCLPLPEDVFQAAIKENYLDKKTFKVELTTEQVHRLVKLFRPLPGPGGRSPPRPRLSQDQFEVAAKARAPRYLSPRAPRYPETDRFPQERLASRRLSPRAKYEPNLFFSDRELLPPTSKYETSCTPSDRYRTKLQQLVDIGMKTFLPSEERRIPEGRVSDDLYLNRELRLQQDIGSLVPVPAHTLAPSSLSAYSADPLRPLSDLRQPRARDELYSVYQGSTLGADLDLYRQRLLPDVRADVRPLSDLRQPRARDELYSVYSQGSTLGADLDLYQQRLLPDVRADVLDRRVAGVDPLVESSLVHSAYSGGLSSDLSRGRSSNDSYASYTGYGELHRIENGAGGLLSGRATGPSGLAYRGDLLPQSGYYGRSEY